MLRKDRPVTKWIKVSLLRVIWLEAQQPLVQSRVARIANSMDDRKLGILMVCPVGDAYHLIDGQHRAMAVMQFAGPNELIQCNVYKDCTTPAQAADLWTGANMNRAKPAACDAFIVAVTAGNEPEVAVNKIIVAAGLAVGKSSTGIRAVAACTQVYTRYGADALAWVFRITKELWGAGHEARQAFIILGVGQFWARFHEDVNEASFVKKVSKRYTPDRLIGAAKGAREMFQGHMATNVVRVLVSAYNKALPEAKHLKMGE